MDTFSVMNSLQKMRTGIETASAEDLKRFKKVILEVRFWEYDIMKSLSRVGNMVNDIDAEIEKRFKILSMEIASK